MQPGLYAVENIVAGKYHAFFFNDYRCLVEGVAWHMDHLESVVTDVHGHGVLEGDHRGVGSVSLQQCGFVRTKCSHPGGMFGHVSV